MVTVVHVRLCIVQKGMEVSKCKGPQQEVSGTASGWHCVLSSSCCQLQQRCIGIPHCPAYFATGVDSTAPVAMLVLAEMPPTTRYC